MRLHFSLLLGVASISSGIALGENNSEESKAIKWIESLGGKVLRDGNKANGKVKGIGLDDTARTSHRTVILPGLVKIRPMSSLQPKITDAALKVLTNLNIVANVEVIGLTGCTQVTDAGVSELASLVELEGLSELRELHVIGCRQMTRVGKTKLKTHLPKLQIRQ